MVDVKPELLLLPPWMKQALTHGRLESFAAGLDWTEEGMDFDNHMAVNEGVVFTEMTNLEAVSFFLPWKLFSQK